MWIEHYFRKMDGGHSGGWLEHTNELWGWFSEGLYLGIAVAVKREGSTDRREWQDLTSGGILGMEETWENPSVLSLLFFWRGGCVSFLKSLLNWLQYCFCLCFGFLEFFWLQGSWDLSSLTRDWTCSPCTERWKSQSPAAQGSPKPAFLKAWRLVWCGAEEKCGVGVGIWGA